MIFNIPCYVIDIHSLKKLYQTLLLRIRGYVITSIDPDFGHLPRALHRAPIGKSKPFAKGKNEETDSVTPILASL